MDHTALLVAILLLPVALSTGSLALRSVKALLTLLAAGVLVAALLDVGVAAYVLTAGTQDHAGGWIHADALSALHLIVMSGVFVLATLGALLYFGEEIGRRELSLRQLRTFVALWFGALSAMTLVLVSNNLGMMWVGIEATTLLTAFLIAVHESRESLEATWKYLVVCSVGVAFAFLGTLMAAASAQGLSIHAADVLLWTQLRDNASHLNPTLIKAAFVFVVVGYGTKVGLAPMHSWLPDAHSQAPSPVSALFSGFMLSAAMYCIMRYLPIVESATGNHGWGQSILTIFGVLSVLVAASFMLFQRDLKRLLAYSSVEHMGIVALGLGCGGLGVFAALFHTVNHSIAKTLAFICAGRLGQVFGTHDLKKISGACAVSPVWGWGMLACLLGLAGLAPCALFMSEFLLVKALVDKGSWAVLALFLAGVCVVFIGILTHAIPLAWGSAPQMPPRALVARRGWQELLLVCVPLALLLALGVWMPPFLSHVLSAAADTVRSVAAATGGRVGP